MNTDRSEKKSLDISPTNDRFSGCEALGEFLKHWRQRLCYCSLFAAFPALLAGGANEARAEDPLIPEAKTSGRDAGFLGLRRKRTGKPSFLRRAGGNRLANHNRKLNVFPNPLLGGNDNCPGQTVPNGVYTGAAPYTDTGDTTGADNTVDKLNYYYYYYYYNYYYAAHGPDRVYSFNVHNLGTNPQIQVTTTSPTYRPMIYLLADEQGCPAGTGNEIWSWISVNDSRWNNGNTATVDIPSWAGSRMYHVFVDSSVDGDAGPYTLRLQGVEVGPNREPVAVDDAFTAYSNSSWNISVLANDTDPDRNLLSVSAVTQGSNGSVVNNGSHVTYTPNPGFTGPDTFTYTTSDGQGGTDTATVAVTVNPNSPPVANDDLATVHSGFNVIDVFANDSDPDGNPFYLSSFTQGTNGSVSSHWLNDRYVLGYTPNLGFSGTDTFTYTISDGRGGFATATVTLTVIPNRAPSANDDAVAVLQNSDWTWVYVLGNDTDPDENPLSVSAITQGSNGSVVNHGSAVQYKPNPGFTGVDTFTYTTSDGQGASDTATVTVSVGANVNFALAANGGVASASSTYSDSYPTTGANNGDRKGLNWGSGGGWADATRDMYPDWLDISFGGSKPISKIDVFTLQDNFNSPSEPFEGMVFSIGGITSFDIQYHNGSDWVTVPGGSITNNNLVWRTISLSSPIQTTAIRIRVNAALVTYSRITEVEAWGVQVGPTPTPTISPTPTVTPTPTTTPEHRTAFDFDGDGKADQGVYRDGAWHLLQSKDGVSGVGFGLASDRLVASDYDGDGKTDVAIYRDGVWWVLNSNGTGYSAVQWGIASDTPVPADYDGDGKADLAVYRGGEWWILYGNGAGYTMIQWGIASDKPVPADYDGDGKADLAVYRDGEWWILFANGSGYTTAQWGIATDKPIPADYDGDGNADHAVYRDGEWWVLNSNGSPSMMQWGIPGDQPVPADYDGDGKTDLAIYRSGEWWTLFSTGYTANTWGIPNDIPVPGR